MVHYRKTRIVCVSDTHGYSPIEGFSLPAGDVLIHAGDLSNRGTRSELARTLKWIEEANYEVRIVVAGNHDVSLDPEFYAEHGSHFHGDVAAQEENATAIDLVNKVKGTSSTPIIFLNHESTVVKLTRPDGPQTTFKVFGSPFSRFSGLWAFGYSSSQEDGNRLWSQIPLDTDILVTHTPPLGLCDRQPGEDTATGRPKGGGGIYGCEQLLDSMGHVRPLLAVCGHVHEGRGYQRVMWNENVNGIASPTTINVNPLPPASSKKQSLIDLTGKKQRALENISSCEIQQKRHDYADRRLRKETCIVNAAIMAKSWPYTGGKAFNRPVVVDINLPVWDAASV
ncbi:Ser/Thr protein phosphatase family protein [Talaromyces stipitatus ATCC 10500]|uniref:Ser/Thr protein phosphatase family protein n=1 Tax=Talaromyces stipitatus (strain ATCC 10500 / CBS 375.48 / QM 6759 / NRRL 1006) TaxID=441959 RepID=B8M848_TALSN|nr:Ser/Thr protein phosphatase family protein [Talaromyces stipitatus ATCC 10500]EED20011.1 Ser/Thr protein phosphatase family protein [Talaromyces stipitatus ATCC 10500]